MKKLLLALLLLCVTPALASSDGTTPVIVFHGGNPNDPNPAIVCTKTTNVVMPDVCFDFVPTAGDTVAQHYTFSGGTLVYSPPAVVVPPPHSSSALHSKLVSDINTGTLPVQIIQHAGFLIDCSDADRKTLYAKFLASNPAWWTAANDTAFTNDCATWGYPVK